MIAAQEIQSQFQYQGEVYSFTEAGIGNAFRVFLFSEDKKVKEFHSWRATHYPTYSDPEAWLFFQGILEIRNGMIFQKLSEPNENHE